MADSGRNSLHPEHEKVRERRMTGDRRRDGRVRTTREAVAASLAVLLGAAGAAATGLVAGADAGAQTTPAATWHFAATGSLLAARAHASTAVLHNGEVLVAGGTGGASGAPLATSELYDPATGSWKATGSLPLPIADSTTTVLDSGEVLVAGGLTGSAGALTPTGDSMLYDPATGTWAFTAKGLSTASYGASAALTAGGDVLYAGGLTSVGAGAVATSVAELYDPATRTWSSTASLPEAVSGAESAALPGGRVLVAGGETGSSGTISSQAEVYIPWQRAWKPVAPLQVPVADATTTALGDGVVLVAGGKVATNGTATNRTQIFLPGSGSWTAAGNLPFASYGGSAVQLRSGAVLAVGGMTGTSGVATTAAALFSLSTKSWSSTASSLSARAFAALALLGNGDVLVAGGQGGSGPMTESELFAPVTTAAPAFTSPAALQLRLGSYSHFVITATGSPAPRISESGTIPSGMSFAASSSGTAVIWGTPRAEPAASYEITLVADNGVGSPAVQHLVISFVTPTAAPAFTSPAALQLRPGAYASLKITASGSPAPSISVSGTLPPGMFFAAGTTGSATIWGRPLDDVAPSYDLTLVARNGVGSPAVQHLVISFAKAPVFTSPPSVGVLAGHGLSFAVTCAGLPAPRLSESGALPPGLSFRPGADGSASISGSVASGVHGTFGVTLVAENGVGNPVVQHLSIVVSTPQPPRFTTSPSTQVQAGSAASITLASFGVPTPALSESGQLPPGLTFSARSNGSAVISGTPPPSARGSYPIIVTAANGSGPAAVEHLNVVVSVPMISGGAGYWYATATSELVVQGAAAPIVARTPQHPAKVVAMAATPDGLGYYLLSSAGGVSNYGDAAFSGSIVHLTGRLRTTAVAIAVAPGGHGYYIVTARGNVFQFGDANWYGSPAHARIAPVAAFAVTPDGHGYWVVTVDGQIYPYGDARFLGAPADHAATRVAAFAATPDGNGYWLVTTSGEVMAFGDAGSYGSLEGKRVPPIKAFAPTADGHGYWIVSRAGNVYNFGDADFYGSSAHTRLSGPVTAFAVDFWA